MEVNINKEEFKIHGRVMIDENKSAYLCWANSGFSFSTNAKKVSINIAPYLDKTLIAILKITINGKSNKYYIDTKTKQISLNLDDETNTVEVIKITDPEANIVVTSLSFEGDNVFIKPLPYKNKRLLFIGDSITNGFGILGNNSSDYDPRYSDSSESYAYRLATYFDAEIMTQSFSGRGIVNDCNGNRDSINLREVFNSYTINKEPYDFNLYIPDVVIINGGTNDIWGGVDRAEFVSKVVELLTMIKKAYPNTPIIYFYGAMDTDLIPYIKQAIDIFKKDHQDIIFQETTSMNGIKEETGSFFHPSIIANTRFFNELKPTLSKIFNS